MRRLPRRDEARLPPRIGVFGGGEQEGIHDAAGGAAEQAKPWRAADRAVGRVVLDHDRRGRWNGPAQQPGLRREDQAVHVRDVRLHRGNRPRETPGAGVAEAIVDAVSRDSRAAVKSLHHRDGAGPGTGERLAPAGLGEIAVEQFVRIRQLLIEPIVDLSDGKGLTAGFHWVGLARRSSRRTKTRASEGG